MTGALFCKVPELDVRGLLDRRVKQRLVFGDPQLIVGTEGLPNGVGDPGGGSDADSDGDVRARAQTLLLNHDGLLEANPVESGDARVLGDIPHRHDSAQCGSDPRQNLVSDLVAYATGKILGSVHAGEQVVLVSLANAGYNFFTSEHTSLTAGFTCNLVGAVENFLLITPQFVRALAQTSEFLSALA